MNIRPLAAKLSHVDGQTDGQADLTKLIVAFRNFADTIRSSLYPFLSSRLTVVFKSRNYCFALVFVLTFCIPIRTNPLFSKCFCRSQKINLCGLQM